MAESRVTFFADENISHNMARLLDVFDPTSVVKAHIDCFDQGTLDTVWLKELAAWDPKPHILSGDGRILRNKAELAVLKESNLTFVFLARGWTNLAWQESAWKIIKAWPGIVAEVTHAREPSVFELKVGSLKIALLGTVASQR